MLIAAACGGGDADTTTPSQFPTGSVRSWFDALEDGDSTAALELTYERSMLVIIGAENSLPIENLASLLRRGATDSSAENYLTGFGDALRDRYGSSLSEVSVDGFNQIGHLIALGGLTLPDVEFTEQRYPVRFRRQEFRCDGGGAHGLRHVQGLVA